MARWLRHEEWSDRAINARELDVNLSEMLREQGPEAVKEKNKSKFHLN